MEAKTLIHGTLSSVCFPLFQRNQLSLAQEKSKYDSTISPVCERKSRISTLLTHGMPGPRRMFTNGKVKILHTYVCESEREREFEEGPTTTLSGNMLPARFPLFQRNQLSLTQEKSKYHSTTSPTCRAFVAPVYERKSRNNTHMPGPRSPIANRKVEITHI